MPMGGSYSPSTGRHGSSDRRSNTSLTATRESPPCFALLSRCYRMQLRLCSLLSLRKLQIPTCDACLTTHHWCCGVAASFEDPETCRANQRSSLMHPSHGHIIFFATSIGLLGMNPSHNCVPRGAPAAAGSPIQITTNGQVI